MKKQLIDVHAHFVTDDYVAAAREAGIDKPDGMPGWPTFDLVEQLAAMDRRGIAKAILSISSPGVHLVPGQDAKASALAEHVNDTAARFVRDHPARFSSFASVPLPDVDASLREMRRSMDAGAVGITVESNVHGRYLGDADFEPIWQELDRRHGILFIHPTSPATGDATTLGLPRPLLEFLFDSTRTVVDLLQARVVARYPNIRVIVTHSGATLSVTADRVATLLPMLLGPDSPPAKDFSAQLASLWFDMAGTPFPRAIPALIDLVGTERILYGSDSCWTPAPGVDAQLASIDTADAPQGASSWRDLTSANAEQLLDSLP